MDSSVIEIYNALCRVNTLQRSLLANYPVSPMYSAALMMRVSCDPKIIIHLTHSLYFMYDPKCNTIPLDTLFIILLNEFTYPKGIHDLTYLTDPQFKKSKNIIVVIINHVVYCVMIHNKEVSSFSIPDDENVINQLKLKVATLPGQW
jgi:hypothetical protein